MVDILNWDKLNFLITGGCGFIGINLIERLVELGTRKIRVVDNIEREKNNHSILYNNKVEFFNIDLRDKSKGIEIYNDIDIVVHLASKVGGVGYYKKYPADVLLHNTLIDGHVLESVRKSNVWGYLYASSAYVYPLERMQDPYSEALNEDDLTSAVPAVSYGWAKLIGEQAVQYAVAQDKSLRAAIFKLANPYGPNQSINLERGSIIPVLIRRAVEYSKFKSYSIFGTGEETRSFCYISDVIDCMIISIEKMNDSYLIGPLNIGSEERIRIIDLARKIIEISGKDIDLKTIPASRPFTMSQTLNCSLARNTLSGWKPRVSLDNGLRKMYSHIEKRLEI